MKKVALLLCFSLMLWAGTIEKTFFFSESDIGIQKQNGYDYITLKGGFNPRNLGAPFLPCKTARFVIPPSAVVTDVKVISSSSATLSGVYYVYPAQKPVPISFRVKNEFIPPDETIYESDSLYPGKLVNALPTGDKAGFRIAQINLFPIQYEPKQRELIFYNSITIRIDFKEGSHPVKKLSERQIQIFGKGVKEIVNNPEDVERYTPSTSSYGLLITPYPIEGVKIAGKTKVAPTPHTKSETRILKAETRKIPQTEEGANKPKREGIKNPTSDFVVHKPYLEAPHPHLPAKSKPKGTVVDAYISSPHPYADNMNQSYYVYGPPENTWMCIYFDTINVESGYDTLYVYDNDGTLLNTYSGAYGHIWSDWGAGPTFTVKIVTDGSVMKYGFDVNFIQGGRERSYENSTHPYDDSTDESVDMYGPANDWIGGLCFYYDSIRTEQGYDSVYCYDHDNTTILNAWSGDTDNVWSSWSSYNINYTYQPHERSRLVSDGSVTEYGWLVDYYDFYRGHDVESAHNYPDGANQTYYVYGPQDQGPIQMRLHFAKLYTESGYDTVYVYDGKGNLMNSYTGGDTTNFWTNWGDSNFVRIVLKSDGSVNYWGFKCDQYEWQAPPNLTYYQPTGWSSPLVCADSVQYDTTATTDDTLIAGDTSYISWAMQNNGAADATDTIYYYLYIDNNYLAGWYSDGLPADYYVYVEGYKFVESTAGNHTLSDTADATNRITESDETDNGYALTYYWKGNGPNLTYYTPSGWDYPIVPSSESGTHTVGPNLQGDSTTYIDWAIVNNGDTTAKPKFYTYLYSDDVPLQGWYTDSLKAGNYAYVEDWTHTFTAGDHTLMTFADSTDTVAESDESDNKYSRTFTWGSGGGGGGYTGNAEYIIITDPSFVDAFKPLRDWKTKKGVSASIVTTDSIYNNYTGVDNAEKVRNFIKDAKDSGAVYILFGGQCDYENGEEYVVRRNAYCFTSGAGYYSDEDTIPCDLYYSDLDSTWDADGDGVYGDTLDAVDMYADIYVGRAPVKDTTQVQNFVSKVLTYEKNPSLSNYATKIYLPQGDLWDNNTGQGINDTIADTIPDSWQKSKQYEDVQGISEAIVNDSMNAGFNLMHCVGHGNEVGIYYNKGNDVYYSSGDPPNNTNDSTRASIVNSIGCFNGALDEEGSGYDYDCLAERMVNNNKHACVATVMNSRYGWGYSSPEGALGPSGELSVWFYRKLFGTSAYHLGEVLASAKDQLVPTASSDKYFRWCLYEHTLFGDPEMPVWRDQPESLYAVHSDTLGITDGNPDTFVIYVHDGAKAAVQGALVTIMEDSTIYERHTTNSAGYDTIIVNPTNTGTASVTVTAYGTNHLPYEGTAEVYNATAIYLSSFTAYSVPEGVKLSWRMETEAGIKRYEIARESKDKVIGTVMAKGISTPINYTYTDKNPGWGKKNYWLKAVYSDGGKKIYGPYSVIARGGLKFGMKVLNSNIASKGIKILYTIPEKVNVNIDVYDITGRKVSELVNNEKEAGRYILKWNGIERNGIYFIKFTAGEYKKTERIIILK